MATTETWTVKSSGGDYTTIAAAVAAKVTSRDLVAADVVVSIELYRNTVESPTIGTGATTDATRYVSLTGGALGVSDAFKHRGRLFGATTAIYGTLTVSAAFSKLSDFIVVGNVTITGASSTASRLVTGPGNIPLNLAADAVAADSCVIVGNFLASGNGTNFVGAPGAGNTVTGRNCVSARAGVFGGHYKSSGTFNVYNCAALGNAANSDFYSGMSGSNNGSGDASATTIGIGTGSLTFSLLAARLASLIAYGTFDNEPAGAPGKIDRCAFMRRRGDILGIVSGGAAISGGLLTGAAGNATYVADTIPCFSRASTDCFPASSMTAPPSSMACKAAATAASGVSPLRMASRASVCARPPSNLQPPHAASPPTPGMLLQ